MEIKAKAGDLEDVFQVLKMHVNDGILQFTEDGIIVQLSDPSNAMMLDFFIEPEFFESYNIEFDKHKEDYAVDDRLIVGLHIENLYELFRRFSKDDKITLKLEGTNFTVSDEHSELGLPVLNLDPDDYLMDLSRIDLDSEAELVAGDLIRQLNKLEYLEDPATIEFNEDEIKMSIDTESTRAEARLQPESFEGKETSSMFSESKLRDVKSTIKKLYSRDDIVNLKIDDNAPLEVEFNKENLKMAVYLAPRVPT